MTPRCHEQLSGRSGQGLISCGLQMAGLKEQDLLFVRYEKSSQVDKACLPYYIALDHETQSVGGS